MKSDTVKAPSHYASLDGLRGVAAVIVLLYHIGEAHAVDRFTQMFNHGYLAVDFFFIKYIKESGEATTAGAVGYAVLLFIGSIVAAALVERFYERPVRKILSKRF